MKLSISTLWEEKHEQTDTLVLIYAETLKSIEEVVDKLTNKTDFTEVIKHIWAKPQNNNFMNTAVVAEAKHNFYITNRHPH